MVINDSPFEGEIFSWYAVNSSVLKVLTQVNSPKEVLTQYGGETSYSFNF